LFVPGPAGELLAATPRVLRGAVEDADLAAPGYHARTPLEMPFDDLGPRTPSVPPEDDAGPALRDPGLPGPVVAGKRRWIPWIGAAAVLAIVAIVVAIAVTRDGGTPATAGATTTTAAPDDVAPPTTAPAEDTVPTTLPPDDPAPPTTLPPETPPPDEPPPTTAAPTTLPPEDVGPVDAPADTIYLQLTDGRQFPIWAITADDGSSTPVLLLPAPDGCWLIQYGPNDADTFGTCTVLQIGDSQPGTTLYAADDGWSLVALRVPGALAVIEDGSLAQGERSDVDGAVPLAATDEVRFDGRTFTRVAG
jgi:hypothetical protein